MQKTWILGILLLTLWGCETWDNAPTDEENNVQNIKLTTATAGYAGVTTPPINTQIKAISALLFNNSTRLFYKEIDFDVIDTSYVLQIPVGVWDIVLLGTGDGIPPTFATSPTPFFTRLTDPMIAPAYTAGTGYGNLREYFYAHQVCTVTSATATLPKMTLQRIISKLTLQTSSTLADSLIQVQLTLKNVVSSVNFLGAPATTYVDEVVNQTVANKVNGIYSFTLYSLGSKPLGSNQTTNFMVDMLYVRKSVPNTQYHFYMYSPADFLSGGMVPNTSINITLGI